MTPPTHRDVEKCADGADMQMQNRLAARFRELVGGVITPPYNLYPHERGIRYGRK